MYVVRSILEFLLHDNKQKAATPLNSQPTHHILICPPLTPPTSSLQYLHHSSSSTPQPPNPHQSSRIPIVPCINALQQREPFHPSQRELSETCFYFSNFNSSRRNMEHRILVDCWPPTFHAKMLSLMVLRKTDIVTMLYILLVCYRTFKKISLNYTKSLV